MAKWVVKSGDDYRNFKEQMKKKFDGLVKAMETVPAQTIYECLLATLKKSVPRAPLEEGSLRESGHVSINGVRYARGQVDGSVSVLSSYDPTTDASDVEFEIGYTAEGGGTGREGDVNRYAMVQHEHTEFNHPLGGEAKFLETAVREDMTTWKRKIADELKRKMQEVK